MAFAWPTLENVRERGTGLTLFMDCREEEHQQSPACPDGHGRIIISNIGESALCPVMTRRDQRGIATLCGAPRDPVNYRPDGQPIDQGRRTNGS